MSPKDNNKQVSAAVRILQQKRDASARATHLMVKNDPLITYEKAFLVQAAAKKFFAATFLERKIMSTKTSFKRIALVAASALAIAGFSAVPANAADWSVDPFSGEIKDGFIWGRGAVDMKNIDAMILACVRMWARNKLKPPRNVLLVFFADEEASGTFGSRWLVKNRPELFAGYSEAVSEVGGFSVTITGDHRLYLVEAAQKGIQWLKLTAKGSAGHGSFINNDNAVTKISEAVTRIGNHEWPQLETKTGAVLFKKIAELTGEEYNAQDVKPLMRHLGPAVKMIGATIQNTANPTMLEAGYKANVIPQNASAVIDGRFLPGYESDLHETIKKLAGEDIEIEFVARDIALEVEFTGDLVEAMCSAILGEDPDGIPVPYLMSGGTDNKALSELGIKGYGFSPLKLPKELDFFSLFHGVDERVPIDGLKFGARVMYEFLENI